MSRNRNFTKKRSNGNGSTGGYDEKLETRQNKARAEGTSSSGQSETSEQGSTQNDSGGRQAQDKSKKTVAKTNDPAWYAYSAEMLLTSANLPFSDSLGVPVHTGFRRSGGLWTTNVTVASDFRQYAIPGIASFKTKPTVGYATQISDPVNVAATALYTHVRVVNSGRKNYDASDLMMYALTIGDLYSMIQWCKRIYACAFMYSQRNMYLGKELLVAQNVDVDDIIRNLANFATWLNTFISKVAVYALPNSINYFKRKIFMYSSVYLENSDGNIKDALYQFIPDGFYRFQLDSNNVGMLKYVKAVPGTGSNWTFYRLATYMDSFINAIYGDEDFALMSGDIIKAYGTELFGLQELGSDEAVSFGYDADVLYQMKNADIVHITPGQTPPTYPDIDNNQREYGDVYQDSHGNLLCREVVDAEDVNHQIDMMRNRMVDSDLAMPSPLNVMESTRLQVALRGQAPGNSRWMEFDSGVDYVTEVDFRYGLDNASNNGYSFHTGVMYCRTTALNLAGETILHTIDMLTLHIWAAQFRYAPNMFSVDVTQDSTSGNITLNDFKVSGNVENYCWFDKQQLARMHSVALLSLFWVPGIAKLVNFGKSE